MSKRKSAIVANSFEDFEFEDQESAESPPTSSKKSKITQVAPALATSTANNSSRVSSRTKKIKEIYDPSENLKPLNKRKKDGPEGEKSRHPSVSMEVVKSPSTKTKMQDIPMKTANPTAINENEPIKTSAKVKVEKSPSLNASNKKVGKILEKIKKPVSAQPATSTPIVSAFKEPSKRIQEKRKKISYIESSNSTTNDSKKPTLESNNGKISSSSVTKDLNFDGNFIPNTKEWSDKDVSEYFHTKLGFSKKDASLFVNQEIDGEALLIMKRSDVVNNKFPHIKLGTAIKFWSHILRLQTGSNDPTQAWN